MWQWLELDSAMSSLPKSNDETAARIARRRSVAIALMLGLMVVLFYAATLVRFGGVMVK
jgi:hypothetical protein